LEELRDAGVVVLRRPFHKMNGDWVWWGGKAPADFILLWRDMHAYFTVERGLNHLLSVSSPNSGAKVDDYCPGRDWVDLVGLDAGTGNVDLQPNHSSPSTIGVTSGGTLSLGGGAITGSGKIILTGAGVITINRRIPRWAQLIQCP
jgi:hypothetical protein